jgi:hypothetical protein
MPTLQSPRLSIPPVAPLRKWHHQSRLERKQTARVTPPATTFRIPRGMAAET